jgi:hypothetical protein
LHPDERADTVAGFVERAPTFFESLQIRPKRLQTDNARCCTHNLALARQLAERGIGHRTIPTRTPKRNGKVERYQQTLEREWALGQRYRSSQHRALALPHWLEHYNTTRRHSAIGNCPPVSRVRKVLGQLSQSAGRGTCLPTFAALLAVASARSASFMAVGVAVGRSRFAASRFPGLVGHACLDVHRPGFMPWGSRKSTDSRRASIQDDLAGQPT